VSMAAIVISFTIALCASRADETSAPAQQPIADGEAGLLVLQDGGVLTGEITRVADWYLVSRGSGQMQVAQSRVLLLCRTLHEAYEFKRQQISGDKPADHLRLAEWCMRYELRDEAAQELAEARRLDPDLPRLALLERRLEKGGSPPKVKESVYLAHANSRAKPPLDPVRERQAEVATTQTLAPRATAPTGDLPDGVVELFTRKVQPVLVNNCTVSGCHQSGGKQSFQLDRAILRGESNRRTTMRNLQAALALIDREHPDQSPLLTIPRRTHGGMSGPIYGPRQEAAYKHLVDWVAVVVPPKDAEATSDVDPNQAEPSNEPAKTAARPLRGNTKATATSAGPLQPQLRPNADVQTASATDIDRHSSSRTVCKWALSSSSRGNRATSSTQRSSIVASARGRRPGFPLLNLLNRPATRARLLLRRVSHS
jgi:hypothetical protein